MLGCRKYFRELCYVLSANVPLIFEHGLVFRHNCSNYWQISEPFRVVFEFFATAKFWDLQVKCCLWESDSKAECYVIHPLICFQLPLTEQCSTTEKHASTAMTWNFQNPCFHCYQCSPAHSFKHHSDGCRRKFAASSRWLKRLILCWLLQIDARVKQNA